jgi:Uma2 family endonuclease
MRSTPDVCLYPARTLDFQEDNVSLSEPPILVVEILSPSQTVRMMMKKFTRYFANGVQSCWLVQPELESVTRVHPNAKPHMVDTGILEDSVVGISIIVEEVFE